MKINHTELSDLLEHIGIYTHDTMIESSFWQNGNRYDVDERDGYSIMLTNNNNPIIFDECSIGQRGGSECIELYKNGRHVGFFRITSRHKTRDLL